MGLGTFNHHKTMALVLSLLWLLVAQHAQAAPPLPASFYGSVQTNGVAVPPGTLVSAWVNGVKLAESATFTDGGVSVFLLDVPGDDPDTPALEGGSAGQTVLFRIAGFDAPQSALWSSGSHDPLNLNAIVLNPDLVVTQDDGRAAVLPGEIITYTLTIRNAGLLDATAVAVTDTLPVAVSLRAASDGGAQNGPVVTWPPFTLPAGMTVTRTLSLQVNPIVAAGVEVITNTFTAADDGSHGPDPTPFNNSVQDANTVIAAPDLLIHLDAGFVEAGSSGAAFEELGKTLSYVLTITNTGSQDASGVVITDVYPASSGFLSASDGGQRAGNIVTWPTFALAGQTAVTRTLKLQTLPLLLSSALVLTNTASVRDDGSGGPDPTPANNSASHVTTIPPLFPPDADKDGMSDECELARGLNPNDPSDALIDSDGDGLLNLDECRAGTDPHLADSDQDGVDDPTELRCGSDPVNPASANRPPAITSTPGTTANQGQLYSYQVAANDPDGVPPILRLLVNPSGMSMSTVGLVTWTPVSGQVGPFSVVVEASDGGTCPARQAYRVNVPANGVDLAVTAVDISDVATDNQTLVAVGTVHVTLENRGNEAFAGSTGLLLFEDHNGNATYEGGVDLVLGTKLFSAGLASGGATTLDVSLSGVVQFWDNLVYAFVDSDRQISELNEENNIGHSGESSRYQPPVGDFQPVVKWRWQVTDGSQGVMMPPLVAPLIDTNGDGTVNERDVPSVIFNTRQGNAVNHLIALRGDTGSEIFATALGPLTTGGGIQGMAVGDLDGDSHIEIVSTSPSNGDLLLFNHNGTLFQTVGADNYRSSPIIFNQDSSGLPEFNFAYWTFNADGSVRWVRAGSTDYLGKQSRQAVDLDLDGIPELIAGPSAYDSSGNHLWWWKITTSGTSTRDWTMTGFLDRGMTTVQVSVPFPLTDAWTAAANLDGDPNPEIIAITPDVSANSDQSMWIFDHDGRIHSGPFRFYQSILNVIDFELGPPTVADFDGDGMPEIAIPVHQYNWTAQDIDVDRNLLLVVRADGTRLWEFEAHLDPDHSYPAPPSAFDFDGDGAAEIVFRDSQKIYLLDGRTGTVLFEQAVSSLPLGDTPYYTTVADVDNDGSAEILIPNVFALNYPAGVRPFGGLLVLGDTTGNWIHARRIWNQWLYNAADVNEDGSIATVAPDNWLTRAQQPIDGLDRFAAPDLTASRVLIGSQSCPASNTLSARIGNGGNLQAGSGVPVRFYLGDPRQGGSLIAATHTTHPLFPGEIEDVAVAWNAPSAGQVYVTVNEVITPNLVLATNLALLTDTWAEANGLAFGTSIKANLRAFQGIDGSPTTRWLEHGSSRFDDQGTAFYEVHFPYPVNATTVTIRNNNFTTSRFIAGQLTFSNGYSTPITLDNKGQGTVTFPEQTGITWVRLDEVSGTDNPNGAALAEFIVAGSYTPPLFRLNEGVGRQGNNLAASLPGVVGCDPTTNQPPAIVSAPPLQAQVGTAYSYATQAVDPDSDPVIFALLSAPVNMSIDIDTGVINWTPSVDQATVVTVTVQAADNRGGVAQQTFSLAVNPGNRPPLFTSIPVTTVFVGQTYLYTATAVDPDGDLVIFTLQQTPANTSFDSLSGVLSWTPSLGQIGTRSFSIAAQDGAGASALQSFAVVVSQPPAAPLPPDLVITKTDQQNTIRPGETVTYTLTIQNSGEQEASGVHITDTLSVPTLFVAASGNGSVLDGVVTWPTFDLAPGSVTSRTVTVQLAATVPASLTSLSNRATVSDDGLHGSDPTPGNNSASDVDTVQATADMVIQIDDGQTSVQPGDLVTYTLTISNTGNRDAALVSIAHVLPAESSFVSASHAGVDLGGAVSWPFLAMPAQSSVTRTVTVRIDTVVRSGVTTVLGTASVQAYGSASPDPTPDNNSASDEDVLLAAASLQISKDDGVASVQPGDIVTYTIVISNTGNQDAAGVVLTDTLPLHTSVLGVGGGGVVNNGVVTWDIGSLTGLSSQQRSLSLQVDSSLPAGVDILTNQAELSGEGLATVQSSDVDVADASPVLVLSKTDDLTITQVGTALTYTLTVSNVGNQEAAGVILTDNLPSYTSFITASHAGVENAGQVVWELGSLTADESLTRTLTVQIDATVPSTLGIVTNRATVSAANADSGDPRSRLDALDTTALFAPPVGVDDSATTDEDTDITIDVLQNDTDANDDSLSIESIGLPNNGTTTIVDTTVVYTPNLNFNGSDSFVYVVSDGVLTDTGTVTVTVVPVNDAPEAADDLVTTDEEAAVVIDALSNDRDVDGDSLELTSLTQPFSGTVSISDSRLVYTPTLNFNGSDSFAYEISDGVLTGTATVYLTVIPINDVPVALDDSAVTDEDVAVTIDVLGNDSDVDGDVLSLATVSQPVHGVVAISGTFAVYTPTLNFNGTDSFSYVVSDGVLTDTATVAITVNPVNDDPTAEDDNASTDEDTPVTISVLANDLDVDGDNLTITDISAPGYGTVVISGTSSVVYTPSLDFNGSDSFTYMVSDGNGGTSSATVAVNVVPVNDAPITDDQAVDTDEDTPLGIVLTASDVEGAPLTYTVVVAPTDGLLDGVSQSLTYTPDADFNGSDSFTFVANDGQADSEPATVAITVHPVNDTPIAVEDTATTDEDVPVSIDVLVNDTDVDGDALTITEVTVPSHGTAVIVATSLLYTPAADYNGPDTFVYTVSDGTESATASVTVTVTAVNDVPSADSQSVTLDEDGSVAVILSGGDVDGDVLDYAIVTLPANGLLSGTAPDLTYTPNADFNGSDSFTFLVNDGQIDSTAAIVSITVQAVNDPPVAQDDNVVTNEDTPVLIIPLANDSDPDGDGLTIVAVGLPDSGIATLESDQSIVYTPTLLFNGLDTFTYVISDGILTDTARVQVTVIAVNNAPVAGDDSALTDEDTPVRIELLVNDSDPDGDALSISAIGLPQNGVATLEGFSSAIYTPAADFHGNDVFTYTLTDGNGGQATGVVSLTVSPVNDAPAAEDDSFVLDEDSAATVDVGTNDTDVDGDSLTLVGISSLAHGSATVSGQLTIIYTPTADFHGTDAVVYIISDGTLTDTATLALTVLPVNDPPIAQDDTAQTTEGAPIGVSVLANDSDIDGDLLIVVSVALPAHGQSRINPDSTLTYTPTAGFLGMDAFTYTISDGNGGTASATVTVTVEGNAEPLACILYPIALNVNTLAVVQPGNVISDIFNGVGSGNFGWLTWTGSNSTPSLVASLTPPGTSHAYVNPNDSNDHFVTLGDWVQGQPGLSNAKQVRDALDHLIASGEVLTVPVWDISQGQGSKTNYRVAAFAQVRLLSYQLSKQNRISAAYVGATVCGTRGRSANTIREMAPAPDGSEGGEEDITTPIWLYLPSVQH